MLSKYVSLIFISLLVIANGSVASGIPDDVSGGVAVNMKTADTTSVFSRSQIIDPGQSLDDLIANSNLVDPVVLSHLLKSFPAETARLITAAIQSGASAITISDQCKIDLEIEQISDIVSITIRQKLEPSEIVLEACLAAVPEDAIINVVIAALLGVDPTQIEDVLLQMLTALNLDGFDGSIILVNSLIDGGFLFSEELGAGCSGECLRPLAEELIGNLIPRNNPDRFPSEEFEIERELPLSNS